MINFRKATNDDISFIEAHAYRLLEFGPPEWRVNDLDNMVRADIHHITQAILSDDPDMAVFIGLNEEGKPVGFIHLSMQTDYYTGQSHAHLNDIVVVKSEEGKGIGQQLLRKAEQWAKEKESRWLTLNVFNENTNAQRSYEKAGFQREWVKYLKTIS